MRNIQSARLALFLGHPDKAEALTKNASALLADDSVDWGNFVRSDKKTNLIDDKYVAIDASMGISEDYVASPEKQEAIKRANQKMAKGDKKGAVEELRLAGIGVMENVC
ncbi:TPA: YfdX family protein, partial [Klebsiella variicola subsp. variicola]|nr:YfdX family protein [Klebsiella variicola subsp. variicola]